MDEEYDVIVLGTGLTVSIQPLIPPQADKRTYYRTATLLFSAAHGPLIRYQCTQQWKASTSLVRLCHYMDAIIINTRDISRWIYQSGLVGMWGGEKSPRFVSYIPGFIPEWAPWSTQQHHLGVTPHCRGLLQKQASIPTLAQAWLTLCRFCRRISLHPSRPVRQRCAACDFWRFLTGFQDA